MTNHISHEKKKEFFASIVADILLTIVTCGIYNLFVQNRQMKAVNTFLGENKYNFWFWLLITIITCGIYHIYHEYIITKDICKIANLHSNETVVILLLSIFGLTIVADALQQNMLNEYIEK